MSEQSPQPNEIARLNDAFRQQRNDWYLTRGAAALPDRPGLLHRIQTYNEFTPDNDPYGERDFCNFIWANEKVYAKIDYYDQELRYGLDPLDPDCRRVGTILLASEY